MLLVLVHWVGNTRTKKDQQELGSFGPEDHHRLLVLLVLVSLPAGTSITTTNSGGVYGVVVP
jgi:hypothetical protein